MAPQSIPEFTAFDQEGMVEALRETGCVLMPGVIQGDELADLVEATRRIRANPPPSPRAGGRCSVPVLHMIRHGRFGDLGAISKLAMRPGFHSLPATYFGETTVLGDILNIETDPQPDAVTPWHTDSQLKGLSEPDYRRLKYHIYLNDVSTENGAFAYILGSHGLVPYLRREMYNGRLPQEMLQKTGRMVEIIDQHIDGFPPEIQAVAETVREAVRDQDRDFDDFDICAPAGSIVVFDDNGIHRGGVVRSGHRSVLRYGLVPWRYFSEDISTKQRLAHRIFATVMPAPYKYALHIQRAA